MLRQDHVARGRGAVTRSSRGRGVRPEGPRRRCGPYFSERAAGTEPKIGGDVSWSLAG